MRTTLQRPLARLGGAGLLLTFALLPAGCGGTGTVSGKVYYKGQPLGGGTVILTNTDGKGSKTAEIQPDGHYTVEHVPAGPAKVAVETESVRPAGGLKSPPAPGQAPNQAPGQAGRPKVPMPPADKVPEGVDANKVYSGGRGRPQGQKYTPLPTNYGDLNNSGETYTVTRGAQDHDIKLK